MAATVNLLILVPCYQNSRVSRVAHRPLVEKRGNSITTRSPRSAGDPSRHPGAYCLARRPPRLRASPAGRKRYRYCIGNGIDLAPVDKGMPKSDWSFVGVAVAVSMLTASVPWLFLIKW